MRSPIGGPETSLPAGAHCDDGWSGSALWHYHDMHQLLFAFDGAVEMEGVQGLYKVPRQFAMWIPAGAVHRAAAQRHASGSVYFAPELLPCTMAAPRIIPAPALLREMVMHAMRWPLEREEDEISAAYFPCLARLAESWITAPIKLLLPATTDPRIAAIMDYTRAHIADVTLADVCEHARMSARNLRRQFTKAAGITWEDYRQRLRLTLALDALDHTTQTIGEIATSIGYETQAAFARAFRAALGMAPRAYRAQG